MAAFPSLLAPRRWRLHATLAAVLSALAVLAAPAAQAETGAAAASTITAPAPDFAAIAQRVGPAVVNIRVSGIRHLGADTAATSDDPDEELLRRLQRQYGGAGAHLDVPMRGLGSGFIVRADGVILTNAHVVADAREVVVRLTDRREFRARVLGSDTLTDVAVLKIDAQGLPTVTPGDPASLRVGQWVMAIGSPYGFDNSVSAGVVSATTRNLPDGAVPFIQTDVAINPGNSGGPLIDGRGEVVGINAQIYTRTGGFQGLSFAIPADLALRVERQILETGHARHARLGVAVQEVDQSLAEAFGLARAEGALIDRVMPASAAERAGLRAGDIVLLAGERRIVDSGELGIVTALASPGQRLALEVWRGGRSWQVQLVLGDADDHRGEPPANAAMDAALGVALRPMAPAELRKVVETVRGLRIEQVQGLAAEAGLEPGDVLLAVNGQPVSSTAQLQQCLAASGPTVALLVQHGDERSYVALRTGGQRSS
ncbi:trypsin-like peptidase domain-containing protein [Rubrivivax gelatinosus]|uniref:Probable periplasmic serine endoprotease DegP-like n=1 Tax=Rubrivivax gelatinosus TaxID=28068 RepID=A0ABS1DY85_RUBGE|nr:trypsin-like peptidase domain-containing protein [Rubrivivax gelatinosus]MBK1714433.1 hypothetical protein [Rubrivivax gelatinosus]